MCLREPIRGESSGEVVLTLQILLASPLGTALYESFRPDLGGHLNNPSVIPLAIVLKRVRSKRIYNLLCGG